MSGREGIKKGSWIPGCLHFPCLLGYTRFFDTDPLVGLGNSEKEVNRRGQCLWHPMAYGNQSGDKVKGGGMLRQRSCGIIGSGGIHLCLEDADLNKFNSNKSR